MARSCASFLSESDDRGQPQHHAGAPPCQLPGSSCQLEAAASAPAGVQRLRTELRRTLCFGLKALPASWRACLACRPRFLDARCSRSVSGSLREARTQHRGGKEGEIGRLGSSGGSRGHQGRHSAREIAGTAGGSAGRRPAAAARRRGSQLVAALAGQPQRAPLEGIHARHLPALARRQRDRACAAVGRCDTPWPVRERQTLANERSSAARPPGTLPAFTPPTLWSPPSGSPAAAAADPPRPLHRSAAHPCCPPTTAR